MWWILLFAAIPTFAQELDLSAIRALEEKLPSEAPDGHQESTFRHARDGRRLRPPMKVVLMEEIKASETELGSVLRGVPLVRLSDNQVLTLSKPIYLRYYKRQDEFGYKYLINKDGTTTFKVLNDYVEPIRDELVLYEPPLKYTPAPLVINKTEWDRKLALSPEVSLYIGMTQADYMADLFNDSEARSGSTNQYGVHLFADWNLPLKVGLVVHYEKSSFNLTNGNATYSAISFGPQLKTRDFEVAAIPLRFQTQMRVSPLAKVTAETQNGPIDFKFNSVDLLSSLERPIKNGWGEFVLGVFFQAQWLNIKDQPEIVSLEASNAINKSFGINFSQVFQ